MMYIYKMQFSVMFIKGSSNCCSSGNYSYLHAKCLTQMYLDNTLPSSVNSSLCTHIWWTLCTSINLFWTSCHCRLFSSLYKQCNSLLIIKAQNLVWWKVAEEALCSSWSEDDLYLRQMTLLGCLKHSSW